jgi:hypothetical protein
MRWTKAMAAMGLVAAVALGGCKLNLKTDPKAEAVADAIYRDVQSGRAAEIQARLTPAAAAVVTREQIQALKAYAPPGAPSDRRLISWEFFAGTDGQMRRLVYELDYPSEAVLYRLTLKRPSDAAPWRVESFHLQRATHTDLRQNRFTLVGRSLGQLLFLAMAVLSPLLMLIAVTTVIRAPKFKRKWLWAIMAFVGVGSATMNWATGASNFQPLMLSLIGAGATHQGFLGFFPWVLKFTLPIGAIAALWRAAKARRTVAEPTLPLTT